MSERNFRTTDLISVLLLYVYVADSFKITVTKDALTNRANNEGRRLEASAEEIERLRKALLEIDADAHPVIRSVDYQEKTLETLKKALRSVEDEEQDDRQIRDIESALRSIERETAYHESRKRTKIEKVLASVEEHTKQAMSTLNATSDEIAKEKKDHLEVSLPFNTDLKTQEGRTVNLKTNSGRKRVFIPKGWMFCTISPPKCYSTNRKKRHINKRHASLFARRQIRTISS
ncbi:hypothetical protein ACROYT_G036888 [Oculina patagonica]